MYRESWREFWRSWNSRIGVCFLAFMVSISIYVALTYPWDFGLRVWNNPSYWADNPKAVPPDWSRLFMDKNPPPHMVWELREPSRVVEAGAARILTYIIDLSYDYDQTPSMISISIRDVVYHSRKPPMILVALERPDGVSIDLTSISVSSPRAGESPPYRRYVKAPRRLSLSGDPAAISALARMIKRVYGVELESGDIARIGVERILFGELIDRGEPRFDVLKGRYRFIIKALTYDPRDSIGLVRLVLGGRTYGALGTDTLGRDLAVGLLFGFPIALLIGVVTSTITTAIGAMIGIISGYLGGRIDTCIQRICDVLLNIPLLPILIFFTFILGAAMPRLVIIFAILIAFSWPGLAIIVRPMILQIKSSQFVEAAVSMGAPRWWIMLRHIFPQIAPFIFAQMIFFTPSAILAEASLSFLGLGDPTIPTWGQILEYGFRSGAVYLGYWWWILPPGLLIVFAAITFVLIALGLEPVVNPRLRRMR